MLFDQEFVARLPVVGEFEDFEDLGDAESVPDLSASMNSSQSAERSPGRKSMLGVLSPYSGLFVKPRRTKEIFLPSFSHFADDR